MVPVDIKRHVYLLTQITITFCERNLKHHDMITYLLRVTCDKKAMQ